MAGISYDTFFNGRLRVAQPVDGYRYSLDAILLAASLHPKAGQLIFDLGAGCGIIPLIIGFRNTDLRIAGIEVQPELAQLAEMNVSNNGMQDRIRIIHGDLRHLPPEALQGPADWIVSNPPYHKARSGRINPDSQRALARHEIKVNLQELVAATRRLLRTGGRFATIYPADRTTELLIEMRSSGIEPKWIRSIHSHSKDVAKLVLVQGIMGGKPGLSIDPPLVIYGYDEQYSDEVLAMMNP